jgi:hypothetical protein
VHCDVNHPHINGMQGINRLVLVEPEPALTSRGADRLSLEP